jgi:hypothetical protein
MRTDTTCRRQSAQAFSEFSVRVNIRFFKRAEHLPGRRRSLRPGFGFAASAAAAAVRVLEAQAVAVAVLPLAYSNTQQAEQRPLQLAQQAQAALLQRQVVHLRSGLFALQQAAAQVKRQRLRLVASVQVGHFKHRAGQAARRLEAAAAVPVHSLELGGTVAPEA